MNSQTDDNPVEDRDSAIIIYCKEWCEYLRNLVNLLRQMQQSYTFFDLRFNTHKADELVSKLGNPLMLPILEINGALYERPSFSEVEKALDWTDWRQRIDRTYFGMKSSEAD